MGETRITKCEDTLCGLLQSRQHQPQLHAHCVSIKYVAVAHIHSSQRSNRSHFRPLALAHPPYSNDAPPSFHPPSLHHSPAAVFLLALLLCVCSASSSSTPPFCCASSCSSSSSSSLLVAALLRPFSLVCPFICLTVWRRHVSCLLFLLLLRCMTAIRRACCLRLALLADQSVACLPLALAGRCHVHCSR